MNKNGGILMNGKFFAAVVLLALSLVIAFFLEARMAYGATLEIILLIISIVAAVAVVLGLWLEAEWAWPVATMVFSAYLANLIYLFYASKALLLFALSLIVNVGGLVLCMLSTEASEFASALETYEAEDSSSRKALRKSKRRR